MADVTKRLATTHDVTLCYSREGTKLSPVKSFLSSSGVALLEYNTIGFTSLPKLGDWGEILRVIRNADVTYFNWTPGGLELATLSATKLNGVSLIAGHHQPIDWKQFQGDLGFARRAYYEALGFRASRLVRLPSFHHVLSHVDELSLATRLRSSPRSRIVRIPYGVNVNEYVPGPKDNLLTVLFMARLEEQKGADLLPHFASALSREAPDFRLIVAGAGSLEKRLKSQLTDKRVSFMGHVSGPVKRQLLRSASVLIMPSRYETFGLVGIEALASGTPVVAFRNPGPMEYIQSPECGQLVADEVEMARSVAKLSRELSVRESPDAIARRCREVGLRYDWDLLCGQIESMLRYACG